MRWTYCVMFGGAGVDRALDPRATQRDLALGLQASLEALEGLKQREHEQRHTLEHKVEQLQYEKRNAPF